MARLKLVLCNDPFRAASQLEMGLGKNLMVTLQVLQAWIVNFGGCIP